MPAHAAYAHISSVLIVDDSRVQRSHTAALCRELGITRIEEAGNGREALALLSALQPAPAVLIVDLEMPTMDGFELIERLQQHGIDIPIIVASSRERSLIDMVQSLGSTLGLRVLSALQKPVRLETLHGALCKSGSAPVRRQQGPQLPIDAEQLRRALERGEIQVHYQPKADIRSGTISGVEALARWEHPALGLVPPDQFIPIAEHNGLIHQLTIEVMNQAMLQAAAWKARGLSLPVAINLSPLLLEHSHLAQEISSLQQSHGLEADEVVLEITESSLVSGLGVAMGVLARLRLRGFGLSIDDYGTGFSSMQQLARIPFTELKIDRSFVRGAYERENLQVILRSAIAMANELGLVTVAEGVESVEEWRLLHGYGCTHGQGWLIARAMPGAAIIPWLRAHRPRVAALSAAGVESSAVPGPTGAD